MCPRGPRNMLVLAGCVLGQQADPHSASTDAAREALQAARGAGLTGLGCALGPEHGSPRDSLELRPLAGVAAERAAGVGVPQQP